MDPTPLLTSPPRRTETHEFIHQVKSNWPCSRRVCVRVVIVIFTLFFLMFSLAVGYLAHTGAFRKLKHDLLVQNGTVTEPNTNMQFPIHLTTTTTGEARVQVLVGLFLRAHEVAGLNMRIYVESVYFDMLSARKALRPYQHNVKQLSKPTFESILDIIEAGEISFVTINHNMTISPPGTSMHDAWLADYITEWKTYPSMTDERLNDLKSCFSDTFGFKHRPFHSGDAFTLEWSNIISDGPKTDTFKGGSTFGVYNEKPTGKCPDRAFGRAMFKVETLENGMNPLNLLWLLFE